MFQLDLRQLQAIYELHMAPRHSPPGMPPEDEVRGLGVRKRGPRDDLRLKPLNVENGRERFPEKDNVFPPRTAAWRNNLNALSQRRNLLFVAYSHQIYVWEPAGPWQTLGAKPRMIITPLMKSPHAEGYINPHAPHAINNIIVDDLGRDEVLLLVTDSGNVCAYHVEAIFSALERANEDGMPRPLDGSQVEPFFTEYVNDSAWGLAIHKFARMIAVTANTGLITVFAFALVDPSEENSSDSEGGLDFADGFKNYGQNWLHVETPTQFLQFRRLMPDRYRSRNVRLTYAGHDTNIPSVSFLNCDMDPNGTWMVSTDIDNKLFVWKIWEGLRPCNELRFNDISIEPFPQTLRNDERGWSVLALDPRTFRLCRSYVEACGGCPTQKMNDLETVLDLSSLSRKVPDASHLYSYFPPASRGEPEEEGTFPDIFDSDCCISKCKNSRPVSSGEESGIDGDQDSGPDDRMGDDSSEEHEEIQVTDSFARGRALVPEPARPTGSPETVGAQAGSINGHNDVNIDESQPDTSQTADNANNDASDLPPGAAEAILDNPIHTFGQGPMAAAGFLQLAIDEAFDELSGMESGLLDVDEDDESLDGGQESGNEVDHMEINESGGDDSDSDSDAESGSVAYKLFEKLYRNVSPGDEDGQFGEPSNLPSGPAPTCFDFPILHFSQTDIRLIPHPFASYPTVVYGNPLRQPFTHPILTIRACDRFNMVKYVPEHGIVVAATQKGRAAIITLTEAQNKGLAFRINWIVPLESQEKYGDRPLVPLLGMAVGPVQGFEMPPDVPYIPRGVADDDDIAFHYRLVDPDEESMPKTGSKSDESVQNRDKTGDRKRTVDNKRTPNSTDSKGKTPASPKSDNDQLKPLTLSECHATASRIYQPDEQWRGWNPSRRYRLLLTYADNTVMSYEFWYEWSDAVVGSDYDGDRDDYLLL